MIDHAVGLRVDEALDMNTLWAAYGLAARTKTNAELYLGAIRKSSGERFPDIQRFVESAKTGDFKQADQIARTFSLEWRARLYSLAIVMLNGQAPPEWTKTASAALFIFERPFLK